MATYAFTYNAGTPKQRVERHEFATEEAAIKSGRARVGYIDPLIDIKQQPHSGTVKPIGIWTMKDGLPSWEPAK